MAEVNMQSLTDKVSIKDLKEGGPVVKEFKGKFANYKAEPAKQYGDAPVATDGKPAQERFVVTLGFTDVQVIKSAEPYIFPILTVTISYSTKKKSKWGVFGTSLAGFLKEGQDIKDAIGMTMHLVYGPGHSFWDGREKKEVPQDCWEVKGVVGAAPQVNPIDRALELLNGKTAPEFNQVVFTDSIVKLDANLINSIVNGTFLPSMETGGKISKDEKGVYHKK